MCTKNNVVVENKGILNLVYIYWHRNNYGLKKLYYAHAPQNYALISYNAWFTIARFEVSLTKFSSFNQNQSIYIIVESKYMYGYTVH